MSDFQRGFIDNKGTIISSITFFLIFFNVGIKLIFLRTSPRVIEIQNKYREKKGKAPMTVKEEQAQFIKHRILGGIIVLIVAPALFVFIFIIQRIGI